jgi:hypothetical protein
MKTMARIWLFRAVILLCLLVLILQFVQATEEPAELKDEAVEIGNILLNATDYEGKMVVIEGTIETECPSGCWFILDDGTASILCRYPSK